MKRKKIKSIKAPPGEKKPRVGIMPSNKIPNITKLFPFMVIILAYLILFVFLRGKVLFTPDFDQSDAFHLYVSTKYYLWQSLHQGRLPFWTQQLQGGFPLIGEGQTGALYLPNLIFYSIFSFTDAYMLSFVGSLLLFAIGFYLLLRKYSVRPLIAVLLAVSASLGGYISFRWVHFSILQGISLIPLLFLTANSAYKDKSSIAEKGLHAFFIAELFFTGHPQIAFITLFSLLLWYVGDGLDGKVHWKKIVMVLIGKVLPLYLLGVILALPQIAPSLLLMQFSTRALLSGYGFATSYSYVPNQIASFVTPYFYGNPQHHSFPADLVKWGVFWENTPYIGEALFLIISASLIYLAVKKTIGKNRGLSLLSLSLLFLILSFGSNSPLYFIFDLPPFSLFRTPARYLIPSAIFLIWGGSLLIEEVFANVPRFVKLAICIGLITNIILLTRTALSYHVFVDARKILSRSSVAHPLNSTDRYVSFGFREKWGDYARKNGWSRATDVQRFLQFNSSIIPESNLMYGGECFDVNTGGLRLRRIDLVNGLLIKYFGTGDSTQLATRSAMNLLSITGINTFISTVPLEGLDTRYSVTKDNNGLFHYHMPQTFPGYYLPSKIHEAAYVADFNSLYSEGKISTAEAMVENHVSGNFYPAAVNVQKDTQWSLRATVTSQKPSFFVIAKNWYPEWHVELDGKSVEPIKTNLIHMGVVIPSGKHTVTADYIPYSFYFGLLGSITCLVGLAGFICFKSWK